METREFFLFLHFFFPFFAKIYGSQNFLQKYTSSAVGARRQRPTAVPYGGRGARGNVAPATAVGHGGRGLVCFQNFVIFLFELGWR
jgi:hypothetical protein